MKPTANRMTHVQNRLRALVLVLTAITSIEASADSVTTYVVKVQEERKSTRWTLTEWLRIKERMKLMDVWLAMFSSPQKDQFQPEFNLTYGRTVGNLALNGDDENEQSLSGTSAKAQLWLTNLFTGTTGMRLLNVDLGFEGHARQIGALDAAEASVTTGDYTRHLKHTAYGASLRIFGKNIQDSSLVLKYGAYQHDNTIPFLTEEESIEEKSGVYSGAELQLYIAKVIGLEGNYYDYLAASSSAGAENAAGVYYDYYAFVEVSALRLMIGQYQDNWEYVSAAGVTNSEESGYVGALRLQL